MAQGGLVNRVAKLPREFVFTNAPEYRCARSQPHEEPQSHAGSLHGSHKSVENASQVDAVL